MSLANNVGKRSISLDLKHPEGSALLRKQLALVEAGEAVSAEREWLARAQLGGLLLLLGLLAAAALNTDQQGARAIAVECA